MNFYVSPTGNDGNSGLSLSQACKTLSRSIQLLHPGDTLLVDDGSYPEFLRNNIPAGTSWLAPVTIKAINSRKVTLNPSAGRCVEFSPPQTYIELNGLILEGLQLTDGASSNCMKNNGCSYLRLNGCAVQNAPASGILDIDSTGNEYLASEVHHNGGSKNNLNHGFYFGNTKSLVIRGNDVHHNGSYGIQAQYWYTENTIVEFNRIHDNLNGGMVCAIWPGPSDIRNNFFYRNYLAGLAVVGSNAARIYLNTFYNNYDDGGISLNSWNEPSATRDAPGSNGLLFGLGVPPTPISVHDNIFYKNTTPITNNRPETVITHNFDSGDPQFTNEAADDLTLKPGSPATGYGATGVTPTVPNPSPTPVPVPAPTPNPTPAPPPIVSGTGKPSRGTPIDLTKSVTNGMVSCVHCFPDGPMNLVGSIQPVIVGTVANGSLDGGDIYGCNDTNYVQLPDSSQLMDPGPTDFSVEVDCAPTASDINDRPTVGAGAGGHPVNRGKSGVFGWQVVTAGGGYATMDLNNASHYSAISTPAGGLFPLTGGVFHRLLFIKQGSTASWWVDGQKQNGILLNGDQGYPSPVVNPDKFGPGIVSLGRYGDGHFFEGPISRFIYWNRALTDAEAGQVSSANASLAYSYMSGSPTPVPVPTPTPGTSVTTVQQFQTELDQIKAGVSAMIAQAQAHVQAQMATITALQAQIAAGGGVVSQSDLDNLKAKADAIMASISSVSL